MTPLILSAFAAAFVVEAIEALLFALGKWRGLVALLISSVGAYFTCSASVGVVVFTALAGAFLALASSFLVQSFAPVEVARVSRGLPNRIPPL